MWTQTNKLLVLLTNKRHVNVKKLRATLLIPIDINNYLILK